MTANEPLPGVPAAGTQAAVTAAAAAVADASTPPLTRPEPGTANEPVPDVPAAEMQDAASAVAEAPAEGSTLPPTAPKPGTAVRKPSRKRRYFLKMPHNTVPFGYLHVSEALDRLGQCLYPDEWGYIDGFSELPFQFIEGDFVRYALRRRDAKLVVEKVPFARAASKQDRRALRHVWRLYFEVGEQLRLALESRAFTARKFIPTGETEEIRRVGIWAANAISVFCLGVLLESREDGSTAALPVMIDEAAFEVWLKTQSNLRMPSAQILPLVHEEPGSAARQHTNRPPKPEVSPGPPLSRPSETPLANREVNSSSSPVFPAPIAPPEEVFRDRPAAHPLSSQTVALPRNLSTFNQQARVAIATFVSKQKFKLSKKYFRSVFQEALEETNHTFPVNKIYAIWRGEALSKVRIGKAGGNPSKSDLQAALEARDGLVDIIKAGILRG